MEGDFPDGHRVDWPRLVHALKSGAVGRKSSPTGRRLRRAARQLDSAIARRDALIVVMRSEGASLRDIAEAAKLTHTGVRHILRAAAQQSHGQGTAKAAKKMS